MSASTRKWGGFPNQSRGSYISSSKVELGLKMFIRNTYLDIVERCYSGLSADWLTHCSVSDYSLIQYPLSPRFCSKSNSCMVLPSKSLKSELGPRKPGSVFFLLLNPIDSTYHPPKSAYLRLFCPQATSNYVLDYIFQAKSCLALAVACRLSIQLGYVSPSFDLCLMRIVGCMVGTY